LSVDVDVYSMMSHIMLTVFMWVGLV